MVINKIRKQKNRPADFPLLIGTLDSAKLYFIICFILPSILPHSTKDLTWLTEINVYNITYNQRVKASKKIGIEQQDPERNSVGYKIPLILLQVKTWL